LTSDFQSPVADAPESRPSAHRLELISVELVGASRTARFKPGFNIIQGDITTGKTTLVRLIRAMLGTIPSGLPPEVNNIRAIRGNVTLGPEAWFIFRPRTTTSGALVEVSEQNPKTYREPISLRLPSAGHGRTYSTFLLEQLSIPAVSVPQARNEPTGTLTPVTMTDWLGYCIITGDELDTQVFGHHREFRNAKRRWVFELAYGFYEPEIARLNAQLRTVELQLARLDQDAAVREKFLADTPFQSIDALQEQIVVSEDALQNIIAQRHALTQQADAIPGVEEIREQLLATRARRAEASDRLRRLEAQIVDLNDLHKQLSTQSARLTRAIVADEWLVDFDFVVCPRCGNDVNAGRTKPELCYLCLQQPQPAPSRAELLSEQDRVGSQISETIEVIETRRTAHRELEYESSRLEQIITRLSIELDERTSSFVSDRAARIENHAAEQTRIEGNIVRLREYHNLLRRHFQQIQGREELEARRDEISAEIESRELSQTDAEENVKALERRMHQYLERLHIPDLGTELYVRINRRTYLPEVSGRTFDELSSQGLKTLVNIAHALAHHTVALDRDLPLPGLLILDGLSANAGHEGFDQERVRDVYRLLSEVAEEYTGALQVVAVDNPLSTRILLEYQNYLMLTLTQADRLIRIPSSDMAN